MTYDEIFADYYNQYRAEALTPSSTDDEYTIGRRLANSAVRRWASYDNTFWQNLYTTSLLDSTGGVILTTAGTATYAAPTNMRLAGGFVKLINPDGTTNKSIAITDPQDSQFRADGSAFCFFTGDPNSGFVLNLSVAPTVTGLSIKYTYYKKPSFFTAGTDKPNMSNPDFIVNHMLSNRFRASRNPYYGSAKRDAENMLAQMKMENDSGTPANPWKLPDHSGTVWGSDGSNGFSW